MKTARLPVPSPALPERLDRFIAANLPGLSRRRVKALLDAGQVRVDGRTERKAGSALAPGRVVEVDYRPSLLDVPPLGPDCVVGRGDGWWVIHKPQGMPTHRRSEDDPAGVPEQLAPLLGRDPSALLPVHRLDRGTSGALLVAVPDRAGELSRAFEERRVAKRYLAVVSPAPTGSEGELSLRGEDGEMQLGWELRRRSKDGSRAELLVRPREGRTHQVRRQLAAAGLPIVGDTLHGRPVPGGAPRMALHCLALAWDGEAVEVPPPADWEDLLEPPVEPAPAPPRAAPTRPVERRSAAPRLAVSRATARIVRGGHPWLLTDRWTGPMDGLRAGGLVDLVDPSGGYVATALADPGAEVAARVVDDRPGRLDREAWIRRAERAIRRRAELRSDAGTDAYRLVHGEADGLPGLFVDRWGPVLVATRTARCSDGFRAELYETLARLVPECALYEKDHLEDLRRRGQLEGDELPGRWIRRPAEDPGPSLWVRELGLRYRVEPLGGLTTGLYPDQRENRRVLRADVAGARVANLFAHTGAFSVALAAAGALRVVTVDLSARYLRWAEENLEANGLDRERHPTVVADSRAWLAETDERFDLLILDPPAFARGRAGDWSARRDYRGLVADAAARLEPGGRLLCCHNLRSVPKGWLRREVERGLEDAGLAAEAVTDAGPGPDFPKLPGFPEGNSFRGVLVTTRAVPGKRRRRDRGGARADAAR